MSKASIAGKILIEGKLTLQAPLLIGDDSGATFHYAFRIPHYALIQAGGAANE